MDRAKYALIGLGIAGFFGALISYFFDLNFWACWGLATVALMFNGWIAVLEDRGKFND